MLSVAVMLCIPGLANADPGAGPDTMAKLIADVAQANQHLQDLSAQIQTEQESVNKALVDVETARDNAAAPSLFPLDAAAMERVREIYDRRLRAHVHPRW